MKGKVSGEPQGLTLKDANPDVKAVSGCWWVAAAPPDTDHHEMMGWLLCLVPLVLIP